MASLSVADHALNTLLHNSNRVAFVSKKAHSSTPCMISIKPKTCKISMTASNTITPKTRSKPNNEEVIAYEKLDTWMRDSVGEIVKNLKQAPLLVRVYDNDNNKTNGGSATLMTEKAVPEDWDVIKGKWKNKESPLPEGVILVEELQECEDGDVESGGVTRAWGIVVQGRGNNCGPACYLLKTSRVGGSGLGMCCTHFCLMKVKNFRETAFSQLKNCWLLQGQ